MTDLIHRFLVVSVVMPQSMFAHVPLQYHCNRSSSTLKVNTQSYCTWWDYTLCLNILEDLWKLECSASFFQPVAQCCRLLFLYFISTELFKFLGLSGDDVGVQRTVVLYCPECLCAGYPEVIFHVLVPFKKGVSNRDELRSQSEATLTHLTSAAVEHIYVRANGWKKHAAIYT